MSNLVKIDNPSFDLPMLANPEEAMEIMQVNLEGSTHRFERVKIPSGGGITFEVPTEGDPEITQELIGVIIDHHPVNAYWPGKFSSQNNPPACSALDGKMGMGDPGGSCASCPNNQWGSDPDGGRGKACKNIHRIYILREGEILPLLLALPPTSLGNFSQYMTRLTSKLRPFFGCVTKIKLQKAVNKDGITYPQVIFAKVADLTKEETMAVRQYANTLKGAMRAVAVEATDYEVDSSSGYSAAATGTDDAEPY